MAKVYPALSCALDGGVVSISVRMSRATRITSFADVVMLLSKYKLNEDVETVARDSPGSRYVESTFHSRDVLKGFCGFLCILETQ